jgi:NAD(P)H dehydrogenase (quinone)
VIAVTGASGAIGRRVAERLAHHGEQMRLLVRDPARAPEIAEAEVAGGASYDDPEAMERCLAGADVCLLVSAGEDPDRVRLHKAAVDAAVAAGVEHLVYLSFLGAAADCTFTFGRDHFHTEQHIRESGLAWTFLRDSIYLDFVPFFADEHGVIRGPADDGRVAAVARDDVADVAAAVLRGGGHEGKTYDLTGPVAFTLAEAAEQLTEISGREVTFVDETVEEARASRAPSGAPDWEIEGWVTSYAAIGAGELDVVTEDVLRVAGHPPQSLEDFLRRNPESYAHLSGG